MTARVGLPLARKECTIVQNRLMVSGAQVAPREGDRVWRNRPSRRTIPSLSPSSSRQEQV